MRVASKETVKIEKVIERYRNPALMVSFGKDSLVLWHLLKHLNLPIIRHKTPWQPRRWFFGDRMIASNALTVYDWPPEATGMQHDEKMQAYELVSLYTIGSGKVLGIRQKIEDVGNVDGENVCGLHDCLRRPIGTISHAWDLLICAQKNGDTDHFGGHLTIKQDIRQTGGIADMYFPMRDWGDGEVWSYIENNKLSYDTDRYYGPEGMTDPEYSNDIVKGCFRCVRKNTADVVACPRLNGLTVNNVSDQIPYFNNSTSI